MAAGENGVLHAGSVVKHILQLMGRSFLHGFDPFVDDLVTCGALFRHAFVGKLADLVCGLQLWSLFLGSGLNLVDELSFRHWWLRLELSVHFLDDLD